MMRTRIKNIVKTYLRNRGWAPLSDAAWKQVDRQKLLDASVNLFATTAAQPSVRQIQFTAEGNVIELRDGRRYHLDLSTKAGRMWTVPFTGTFEPDETAFVRKHVRAGDIAIDVGANFGWFTILLSQLAGPHGQVHAFEPVPETVNLLDRNVTLNQCRNVHMSQVALDAQDATRDLYLPDIGVSGSFALHKYDQDYQVQKVPTMTLDTYVKLHNLNRVDFIKADIEGAELSMLKGATQTLKRFGPTLMLEVQASSTTLFGHQPADVFAFLQEHGYRVHTLESNGRTQEVNTESAPASAYNFVFTHRDKEAAIAA